jgi:nicotinate-nucleotide--dimethylbenzimidazole phosphoribosyltransferase
VPGLIHKKIMPGTKNLLVESAMSPAQAEQSLQVGIELATEAAQEGIGLIGTGEMGIGNTTASSAIAAVMMRRPVSEMTGRGTGIDDAGHVRKIDVIQRALAFHRLDSADAMEVLAKVGGLEIGGLAGLMLGAAAARIPVVLDGFIAGAAALIAVGLQPHCKDYLIASHRSVERGHQAILDYLGVKPLFDLDLRLGEGTGACLGMSLVFAAIKIITEMATFDEAGVSGRNT